MSKAALQRAVAICGSQSELARRIHRKQGHVWHWLHKAVDDEKVPPAEVVLLIEAATAGAVSRHELRPDLFGQAAHDEG